MTTGEHLAAQHGRAVVDAVDHPMVMAALARLAGSGGWARVLDGKPLEDPLDLADADLLLEARVLARDGSGFEVLRKESFLTDPAALGRTMVTQLQQALQHARGTTGTWTGDDLELVSNLGHRSAASADLIADDLLRWMPGPQAALESGGGRFLDVGTGTAAISRRMCERFPGLSCVGIDVLPQVLDLARHEVAAAGLADRIRLRLRSVAELDDLEVFDLAWAPQIFIPRPELVRGLTLVRRALRPGGGLVVPTLAPPESADSMEQALMVHSGHVLGGGPIEVSEAHRLLIDAGFVDVRDHDYGGQVVMTAVRPGVV